MKWYQQTWAKIVGAVGALGILGTLGTGVVNTVNHWNFYKALPIRLENIEKKTDSLTKGDAEFQKYFDNKAQTFAVGFRVKKIKDEHTGEEKWIKQFRDWRGTLNDIYLDLELSEFYGIDQYYYIDKTTHEKIYCY